MDVAIERASSSPSSLSILLFSSETEFSFPECPVGPGSTLLLLLFFFSCKSFPEAKMTALSQHSANLPANATPALPGRLLSPFPSAGDRGFSGQPLGSTPASAIFTLCDFRSSS